MITLVAGSRDLSHRGTVYDVLDNLPFIPTTVITGGARGVDTAALSWARNHSDHIFTETFYPDWDTYGHAAGPKRNQQMVDEAECLVLIWDGKSRGSRDVRRRAVSAGLPLYETILSDDNQKSLFNYE